MLDTTPPTVTITYPINNDTLTAITTVKANVIDDSEIRKVVFMVDGSSSTSFTDYESPYEYVWDICTSELGDHTVLVEAEDIKNNKGQSTLYTFNVNATYDCLTVCGGTAVEDNCSECYENDQNPLWNSTCTDCANVAGGNAELDDCGVCSEGTSGHLANSDKDCKGVCSGSADTDNCGVCYESGSQNSLWNSTCTILGCDGVANSGLANDYCDVCDGGNLPDIDDCADDDCCPAYWVGDGICDGTDQEFGCDLTCYDNDGGDCDIGRIKSNNITKSFNKLNRSGHCSDYYSGPDIDCEDVCFGSADIDDCEICYEYGDQNSLWNSTCGDNEPPSSVTITNPEDGSTQFNSVVITSTAYDDEGIDYVELWIKSPSSSTFTNQGWYGTLTDDSAPYELIWNILNVDEFDENYEIKVRAYDEAENYTDSNPITLHIYYPLIWHEDFDASSTPMVLSSYSDDWEYSLSDFSSASITKVSYSDGSHNDMLYVKGIDNGSNHLIYSYNDLSFNITDYIKLIAYIGIYDIGTSGASVNGVGLWDENTSQIHFLLSSWNGSTHYVQMTYIDYSGTVHWASTPPVNWYQPSPSISGITNMVEFKLTYENNMITGFINNREIGSYYHSGAAFTNVDLYSQKDDAQLFDNVIVFGVNNTSSARVSSSNSFISPVPDIPHISDKVDPNSIPSSLPLSSSSVPFKQENPLSILKSINR